MAIQANIMYVHVKTTPIPSITPNILKIFPGFENRNRYISIIIVVIIEIFIEINTISMSFYPAGEPFLSNNSVADNKSSI